MKRLLILVVLVVLLGGGGGAGWWFVLREDPSDTTAEAAAAQAKDEAAKKMKRFIELEPIMLPIIREGQVILHVTVVAAIEMHKALAPQDIGDVTLRLRDAFISELHAIYALRYVQERGYDLPIVRQRLMQSGERVLGPDALRSVTIRNLYKRVPVTG
jgi:hypothetical protein